MSLATRCPNCNTVFQVNEEQLKRYSGVVRCGVCNNPFNGIDHLIGRLSHTDGLPSTVKAENVSSVITGNNTTQSESFRQEESLTDNVISSDFPSSSAKIIDDADNLTEDGATIAKEAALKAAFEKQIQSINFDLNLSSMNEEKPASSEAYSDTSAIIDMDAKPSDTTNPLTDTDKKEPFLSPESVKEDKIPPIINASDSAIEKPVTNEELVNIIRQKKKQSGFSQFLWAIGTIGLLVLLGIQGIYRYSEEIITWWPPAEELVNSTCELLSCPVKTPAMKPALSIEAGIPEKPENSPDQYSQTITMTNNSPDLQLWPSLVLELTDPDNKVLLRRIFEPQEYLPEEAGTAKGLQPASGITFKMTFEFAPNSAFKSQVSLLNNP